MRHTGADVTEGVAGSYVTPVRDMRHIRADLTEEVAGNDVTPVWSKSG